MKNKIKLLTVIVATILLINCLNFSALAVNKSESKFKLGDVNLDGSIKISDVVLIQNHLSKLETLSEEQLKLANTNADNNVSIIDVVVLQRYIAEIYTSLPQSGENNTTDTTDINTYKPSEYEKRVIELVNEIRVKNGLNKLELNIKLCYLAHIKTQDMFNKNYFDHISPTYGSPFDMMDKNGFTYRTAGENIAMGQKTPEKVVNDWMNSKGHRENILNKYYTQIGVGYLPTGDYWAQLFIG